MGRLQMDSCASSGGVQKIAFWHCQKVAKKKRFKSTWGCGDARRSSHT